MMPASAASTGPRNEVSSQGCTTTVVAAGTCFALAISRSYFEWGGSATGPIAARVPISLSLSPCMLRPPSIPPPPGGAVRCDCPAAGRGASSRRSCLRAKGRPAPKIWCRACSFADAEQPGDTFDPLLVFGRESAACAQYLLDEIERLEPFLGFGGDHRGNGRERCVAVDQQ